MHSRSYFSFIIVVASILFTSGCSNTTSENVTTQNMRAQITATATGDGSTSVKVDLEVVAGGVFDTEVELSDNDSITVVSGTNSQQMSKKNFLGDISYEASFATEAEDSPFKISLIRENGEDADNSSSSLPAPFNLTETKDVSGNADTIVELTWSNDGKTDPIFIDVGCACRKTVDGQPKDIYLGNSIGPIKDISPARYSIAKLLDDDSSESYDQGCTIDIKVKRVRIGQLDPNFGEGSAIETVQERETSFFYTPSTFMPSDDTFQSGPRQFNIQTDQKQE